MYIKRRREGFALLEIIFAIVVMSSIFMAISQKDKKQQIKINTKNEITFFKSFEEGLKVNFISILDAFEEEASKITSDASNTWGWRNSNTKKTSPFPTYNATTKILTYNIQKGTVPATKIKAFIQGIGKEIKNICTQDTIGADTITYYCPRLVSLTYTVKGVTSLRAHVLGKEIDPEFPPIVNVTYDKNMDYHISPAPAQPMISFTTDDIYTFRRNYSLNKMNFVRNALKKYYNVRLLAEFSNAPTAGLNSMDDEFIFWTWQLFTNSKSKIFDLCIRNISTGLCSNFDASRWRTSVLGKGLYRNKISANLLSGDKKYNVDGFNNQLIIYPITSQCTTSDYETCSTIAPTGPRDNYMSSSINVKPPYVSVVFVKGKGKKSLSTPEYARSFISY